MKIDSATTLLGGMFTALGAGLFGGVIMVLAVLGLISGIIVIAGSVMAKEGKETMMGILTLVFAIVGFFAGGGFIIGSILGIVGGALILAKK